MNVLRILLIFTIFLYFTVNEPVFWKYYLGLVIPYFIITQLLLYNSNLVTPKKKAFISMWTHPSDPQIYGTLKLNLNNLEKKLKEYSEKNNVKISLATFFVKVFGEVFVRYPQMNGHIGFGRFVSNASVDVSIMLPVDDGKESEIATIRNVDKKSLKDLHNEINQIRTKLNNKTDQKRNRRLLIAKYLPTLYEYLN